MTEASVLTIVSYFVAIYFGLIIGNFATTVSYRLPRNINIFGFFYKNSQPPLCSKCGHLLRFYEYLPLISWITTFGKCNYCGKKIDPLYIFLEIFSAALSFYCYSIFKFYEWYIIFFFFGVSSLVLSIIIIRFNKFPTILLCFVAVLGMLYQTLLNFSIYNWLLNCAVVGILCIFFLQQMAKRKIYINLDLIKLIIIASIWCNYCLLICYLSIILLEYYLFKRYKLLMIEKIYKFSYFLLFIVVFINHLIYGLGYIGYGQ